MEKKFSTPLPKKIRPTPFDLGVINVVEHIVKNIGLLDQSINDAQNLTEVLKKLGIHPSAWSAMRDHHRHVSTKFDRQEKIINTLKKEFQVNPAFIRNFPYEKIMFLTDVFLGEPGLEYGYSSYEMHRTIMQLKEQLDQARKEIVRLNDELNRNDETMRSQRQLLELFQKAGLAPTHLKPGENSGE